MTAKSEFQYSDIFFQLIAGSLASSKMSYHLFNHLFSHLQMLLPPRSRRGRAFALHAGDRGSIPGRDNMSRKKQVVTAPLPNARQQV